MTIVIDMNWWIFDNKFDYGWDKKHYINKDGNWIGIFYIIIFKYMIGWEYVKKQK